ncbi:hypothetical protein PspLS_00198 [Pyricularia sp. CBS 133598]|nr:hypothetical protein PspLS_00198 [Pyricularia sp. CBS 133598]
MKTLSESELKSLAGDYFAPVGLYEYTKSLPFLGSLQCQTTQLTAGQWTELQVDYTVGGSGLADGAWIKGTFKFYSDWALFQTSDPRRDNYVSAEYVPGPLRPGQTSATVQGLSVRFDQKGHERPFQKAIIIDIVDGYMNPGDKIVVRIGDRRWGARGTRVQTFVEDQFLMRWYIDPVGTSRFAPIKPDLAIPILPGPVAKVKSVTSRVARPNVTFPIHVHTEDAWGNATAGQKGLKCRLLLRAEDKVEKVIDEDELTLPSQGWTVAKRDLTLPADGDYVVLLTVVSEDGSIIAEGQDYISARTSLPVPRLLFADLHVHSDDTVGTNDTTYNFSYGQQIAGLDVIGYTANDFNITKARWDKTLEVIRQVNKEGEFVVYPGTEWCGNSAAGGDHNVVFLDDPTSPEKTPEFPLDRHGNVARSFEWNEDGPATLQPGAWPLDEVYATYAHAADRHLLIPHVGGRRCNLAWHHPRLERLLEIGSAWGHFEWLLRDAVARGWRLGVCANSDEHRGRCGGGVPGTAVFGTRGGLTGVLADRCDWRAVAGALRARRTFATTGDRLACIVDVGGGEGASLQGDEVSVAAGSPLELRYAFFGSSGLASVEAWDASGKIFTRDLQKEQEAAAAVASDDADTPAQKIRVRWGGARLYDRYREAVWHGSILVSGATISHLQPFGGVLDVPEEVVHKASDSQVVFDTHTSGDYDGVDIFLTQDSSESSPFQISVTGSLGGYVKVGNVLDGNPHKQQPNFSLVASWSEVKADGGRQLQLEGGADLFVSVEALADVQLPRSVEGTFSVDGKDSKAGDKRSIYFVGREATGGKVISSPVFVDYTN